MTVRRTTAVAFPPGLAPRLLAIVHTEEEFDWSKPFDRAETAVGNLRHLPRAQDIFVRHGVKPAFLVDYPVVAREEGVRALEAATAGTGATIGAHLHPWVNPPFDETVSAVNSFPGNLPRALEREKLALLADAIARAVGTPPRDYLAGRYGAGANTVAILQELGFRSDLSVVAMTDYGAEGGPDFRTEGNFCFWSGEGANPVLRIPHNVADVGFLCRNAERPFAPDGHAVLRRLRVTGLLSRCGAMTRVRLSPEGFGLSHLKACAAALVAAGVRVLVFSFHSPSLAPGFTPYVRDRADLAEFLKRIDGFLDYFRDTLGGVFASPGEAVELARAARDSAALP